MWYEESGAAGGLLEKQEHLELLKKWRRVRKKCNKMVGLAIRANAIHSAWLYKRAIRTLESLPVGLCEMDRCERSLVEVCKKASNIACEHVQKSGKYAG